MDSFELESFCKRIIRFAKKRYCFDGYIDIETGVTAYLKRMESISPGLYESVLFAIGKKKGMVELNSGDYISWYAKKYGMRDLMVRLRANSYQNCMYNYDDLYVVGREEKTIWTGNYIEDFVSLTWAVQELINDYH